MNQHHYRKNHLWNPYLFGALIGVGMAVYGYCPGTGVAAMATGKLDAAVGFLGMLAGAALYAWSYDWVAARVLPVWDLGKKRLPDLAGWPGWVWYAGLIAMASAVFTPVARTEAACRKSGGMAG